MATSRTVVAIASLLLAVLSHAVAVSPLGRGVVADRARVGPCDGGACGKPLFLSRYPAHEAHDLARVHGIGGVESYSGFITVNNATNANTFFWFFPAENGNQSAPVAMWLQGGPGGSSMFGLFVENGPFTFDASSKSLQRNPHSWAKHFHMLYVDNPVGTGFSFVDDKNGYARNEHDVATDLFEFLQQFYTIFPEYKSNEFFVTGESYAGKYIPAISHRIHVENRRGVAPIRIPLAGLAIGDGWVDPQSMVRAYPELLYNLGLCDQGQKEIVQLYVDRISASIAARDFEAAFHDWDELMNGDIFPYGSFFFNVTGSSDYFNMMRTVMPAAVNGFPEYFDSASARKSVHIGDRPFNSGTPVEKALLRDVMDSMLWAMPTLLENYRVLVYSGQLDIIIAATLTEQWLLAVDWSGAEEYKYAERKVWKVDVKDTEVAGYVRSVRNLRQVIVRGAGHLVPFDQPRRAWDMIDRFVAGKEF